MMSTYRAVLRGQTLEWRNDRPPHLSPERPVEVYVTLLEENEKATVADESQGQRMAQALERLAQLQTSSLPEDPALWEREIRKDRPLPGRES